MVPRAALLAASLASLLALTTTRPVLAQPQYGNPAQPGYPPYGQPSGQGPCGGPGYPCPSPGYGLPTYPSQVPARGYGVPLSYPPPQVQPPPGYAQPPPSPYPSQPPTSRHRDDSDTHAALFLDLVSIRVGSYDIRGSDADARTWGFLFALDPDFVVTSGYFSMRSTWFAAIGGGTDGLEGQLENSETFGVRGYFGDDHGPFARLGFAYQIMGNNKLYRSYVELPRVEIGYQVLGSGVMLEIEGRAGLVLGGRYFTGDHAERRIDSELEWGGTATLQVDPIRVYASAMRIQAGQTGPGTPIDQLDSAVCINPWKGLLLCGHGALHRGDVRLPTGEFHESTATYFGGTLGFGGMKTE